VRQRARSRQDSWMRAIRHPSSLSPRTGYSPHPGSARDNVRCERTRSPDTSCYKVKNVVSGQSSLSRLETWGGQDPSHAKTRGEMPNYRFIFSNGDNRFHGLVSCPTNDDALALAAGMISERYGVEVWHSELVGKLKPSEGQTRTAPGVADVLQNHRVMSRWAAECRQSLHGSKPPRPADRY